MEKYALSQVVKLAHKKEQIYFHSPLRYVARAILASMFIGLGVVVAFKTGGYFYEVNSPFTNPLAALTFGAAIILIAYGGGDLFTGNTFYYTVAALQNEMRWIDVIKLWMTTYAGNFIGAILFAVLLYFTGLFSDVTGNEYLFSVAEKKTHLTILELFTRAIVCNWLVSLAFFIPMMLKGDGVKMFTMILLVFTFFISGYEHSIANMVIFSVTLVLDHPETITLTGVIRNLLVVTIGNMVGGNFFMGWMYNFANR
ncbi:Nitrite transporter NirC [Paraliobacillus sp. PM-2]|uniref:formate/nitrite transporter family protein n=1 Tax=Paraliobacillus sp. PM-2 TaxID=1462524 RepID=UPI00061C2079|nr:formate/nitrite transporter family protein [Paraliobacillus sp. PM-2]CQR46326.1 Nitrite transporter NirC [Paraliobacillus sp. PM-2]